MGRAHRAPVPLARHYLKWLTALAASIGAVFVTCSLVFVLWPMAKRSADDLASLMVLAAQTWGELPPETRPAFEQELTTRHRLAIRSDHRAPPADATLVHGFYIGFLEDALQVRTGQPTALQLLDGPPGTASNRWLWTGIPTGGRLIGIGFDTERLDTHPLYALAAILACGSALVAGLAYWLARRISQPVARLEQAAAELAAGTGPALLPETGPAELARLDRHFNQMAVQVRELLEARTTLLAGASHDLRTPLARMRLALEMLRLKPDDKLIVRIEHDIEAMDALIGQMLGLARGLDPEAPQRIALAPWLHDRAAMHQDSARQVGAAIEVRCTEGLEVIAAPAALGRLIDNLLGNALRYAPGPITLVGDRLTVSEPPLFSDTTDILDTRITVADRGPGIAAEHHEAVWRAFHRVESSRNPLTGGWGLGLAIVRQLAALHGWRPMLREREGGGLEASVDLPSRRRMPQPSGRFDLAASGGQCG
jgi:two-component system, OmpR family, osmolarity sensor histidine kinase EnvZ